MPLDPTGPPTLETPRLQLRALRLDDVEAVWAYASDPEVTRYTFIDCHQSRQQTRNWLEHVVSGYARRESAIWGLVLKEEQELVGSSGMRNFCPSAARAELGYALARAWWGKGLAVEAVRAIVGFGFESLGLNRVEARCVPVHVASRRVLEKANFQLEGILRQHEFFKGAYQDLALYSMLRQDWNKAI